VLIDVSVPVSGTLRLRCRPETLRSNTSGQTGLIVPAVLPDETPAHLSQRGDHIMIEGGHVEAFWDRGGQGFRFGAYRRFRDPAAATLPFCCGFRPPEADRRGS
jgi:alpha-D-xyloside xylohydrolase